MKNIIMIFIAILAIAGVLAFMVNLDDIIVQDSTIQTEEVSTEAGTIAPHEHILNSKCVCTICGITEHTPDDSGCVGTIYCFECGATLAPQGSHGQIIDGVCTVCGHNVS